MPPTIKTVASCSRTAGPDRYGAMRPTRTTFPSLRSAVAAGLSVGEAVGDSVAEGRGEAVADPDAETARVGPG